MTEIARARLLRPEEIGVEGHLLMIRRHGGTGGRPPREGEVLEPDRAERAEAGWTRPARERPKPAPTGPSARELIENPVAAKRREWRQLEQELIYLRQGGVPQAGNAHARSARLTAEMARLAAEIAEAEAA